MQRKKLFLSSLFLGAALIAPMAIVANAAPQGISVRVYDRDHKDYHDWDANEDRVYRHWLEEKHEAYREYNRLNAKRQREYWEWRHNHEDHEDHH